MGLSGSKFNYNMSVLLFNVFFFFFLDEQLKITNSNTTAWQDSKSNLLDKKRIESNSIHSVSICQHLSIHLESKNQNFFCMCYFCFWSWIRGKTPRTGRNMARRWLRYNLKIFQFCLSLYSFNYFLQTDFIREKKKETQPWLTMRLHAAQLMSTLIYLAYHIYTASFLFL